MDLNQTIIPINKFVEKPIKATEKAKYKQKSKVSYSMDSQYFEEEKCCLQTAQSETTNACVQPSPPPLPRLLQPITLSPPLHASVANLRTCHCPAFPLLPSPLTKKKNPPTLCNNYQLQRSASIYRNQFVVCGDLINNREISVKHAGFIE